MLFRKRLLILKCFGLFMLTVLQVVTTVPVVTKPEVTKDPSITAVTNVNSIVPALPKAPNVMASQVPVLPKSPAEKITATLLYVASPFRVLPEETSRSWIAGGALAGLLPPVLGACLGIKCKNKVREIKFCGVEKILQSNALIYAGVALGFIVGDGGLIYLLQFHQIAQKQVAFYNIQNFLVRELTKKSEDECNEVIAVLNAFKRASSQKIAINLGLPIQQVTEHLDTALTIAQNRANQFKSC